MAVRTVPHGRRTRPRPPTSEDLHHALKRLHTLWSITNEKYDQEYSRVAASITLRVYIGRASRRFPRRALRSATQTQQTMESAEWKTAVSDYGSVVSREGIVPFCGCFVNC